MWYGSKETLEWVQVRLHKFVHTKVVHLVRLVPSWVQSRRHVFANPVATHRQWQSHQIVTIYRNYREHLHDIWYVYDRSTVTTILRIEYHNCDLYRCCGCPCFELCSRQRRRRERNIDVCESHFARHPAHMGLSDGRLMAGVLQSCVILRSLLLCGVNCVVSINFCCWVNFQNR